MSAGTPAPRLLRRSRVLGVAAATLAAAAGAVVLVGGTAGRERDAAVLTARAGDFARAEPGLRAARARDPADAEAAELLARGYLAARDLAAAEAALGAWADLRPDDPEPVRLRMGLYRDGRRFDRAYADGLRLLALQPGSSQARWDVTQVAYAAGEFAKAEELCRAGLAAGEPRYRVTLADARRARGDPAGAAAVLDDVLRADPADVSALLVRAALYDEAGEPAKAAPLLREVIRLDPGRAYAAGYQLAMVLERAGLADEARVVQRLVRQRYDVANAETAAASRPTDPGLRVQLGRDLLAAGHAGPALEFFRAALAIDPGFAPAHAALADYYAVHGRPAVAAGPRGPAGR